MSRAVISLPATTTATAQVRRAYTDLVHAVEDAGGSVHVLSSLHVSGQQLQQYGGVAAMLR